jgi:hypothetical protein
MRKVIVLFIIVFLFSIYYISCNKVEISKKIEDVNEKSVSIDPNVALKDSIYFLLKNYIHKYPQFDAFVLMDSPESPISSHPKGFFIGPAYEGLYNDNFPIFYLVIDEKYVFVESAMDYLVKHLDSHNSVFSKKMIHRGIDSLMISSEWIIKGGGELYIKRALYFSEDKKGGLIINNCPDTIFAPQFRSTVLFKNIKE